MDVEDDDIDYIPGDDASQDDSKVYSSSDDEDDNGGGGNAHMTAPVNETAVETSSSTAIWNRVTTDKHSFRKDGQIQGIFSGNFWTVHS